MCKWNKYGDTRIDPCMRNLIEFIKEHSNIIEVVMCCCGHFKYHQTVIVKYLGTVPNTFEELNSGVVLGVYEGKKKKFYKRDKKTGIYFIPEVEEYWRNK